MMRVSATLAVMALAAPAWAQDDAVHAPCLAAHSLPEVAQAFRAAGWQEVTDASEAADALAAMGQTLYSMQDPPDPFEDEAAAADYAMISALNIERITSDATPVFARNGIYAMARQVGDPDPFGLQCHLTASVFPEAEVLMAENNPTTGLAGGAFGMGVTFASIQLEPSPGASLPNAIDLIRLEGAPDVLRTLAGRYGIITTQFFPETGN